MTYNIVHTTAEDILNSVCAVLSCNGDCTEQFVADFMDTSLQRAQNALIMAEQLSFIDKRNENSLNKYKACYPLAHLLLSVGNQKAVVLRLALEQYKPYKDFIKLFIFNDSTLESARQLKVSYGLSATKNDINDTIISIATFANVLTTEGAGLYKAKYDKYEYLDDIDKRLRDLQDVESFVRNAIGREISDTLSYDNVMQPLINSFQLLASTTFDPKQVVLHAGNAFDSYLSEIANRNSTNLAGKNGIIQKIQTMPYINKKHKGMVEFVGQVRNACDHGAHPDDTGVMWDISKETASVYPYIVLRLIKSISISLDAKYVL